MKKVALFIGMICLSFIGMAQITKGSFFVGGSLGYSTAQSEETTPQQTQPVQENTNYSWMFRPQIGKVISNNQVAGIFLNFSKNSNEQLTGNNSTLYENDVYGGGFFYRRYYPFSQRFFLFGDAGLGVGFGKSQNLNDDGNRSHISSKSNSTQIGLSLTPGLSFAATRKLFLEASLNDLLTLTYSSSKGESFDLQGNVLNTVEQKAFSAHANANGFSNLSIGIRWIFPSKN